MSTATHYHATAIGHGITCFDTELMNTQVAACYLIEDDNQWAIVETGNSGTAEKILTFFADHNVPLTAVRAVAITHVHLDHAGGAGRLMQELPTAELLVHQRGARHMMDPQKLQAGATAVYGEEKYMQLYGNLIPVPENRIRVMRDGDKFNLGRRQWEFYDTPGHARHHYCIFDRAANGIFTGDTLGIAYPRLMVDGRPFAMPTTTPVQFDPDALLASIDRLWAMSPAEFYLTHCGPISATATFVDALKQEIQAYAAIAERCASTEDFAGTLIRELTEHTLAKLREHGCALSLEEQQRAIMSDMLLNAQGLAHWIKTR